MPQHRRSGLVAIFLTLFAVVAGVFIFLSHSPTPVLSQSLPLTPSEQFVNFGDQAVFAPEPRRRRVAIVGAGASGSAAAFFIRRAARQAESRAGLEPGSLLDDIVVYEKEGYVGGRSTVVYPHGDKNLTPHELGASIFVDANRNLVKALFNLSLDVPPFSEAGVAIWDGREFVLETTTSKSRFSDWWDTIAVIRRYGVLSPYRQTAAVKVLLARFKQLYEPTWLAQRGSVDSIDEFAESADLGKGLTTRTGEDWAENVARVSKLWMNEIMEASTRVNYCADMDKIHGLGAAVSFAAAGASSVAGGNYLIFERMLKDAYADVRLKTEVTEIVPGKNSEPSFRIISKSAKGVKDEEFDQVFFAAPWHLSPIDKSISRDFSEQIPLRPPSCNNAGYNGAWPNPAYFGISPFRAIPGTILTTNATFRETGQKQYSPAFQSLSYHGETYPGSGEYVVKLFSKEKLDDAFLEVLFNSTPTWLLRKEWDSYPVLDPIATYAPVEPLPGFQYLAAMEPWVSTMETQTLSAREAVARVVGKWWGLGLGQCHGDRSWDLTCE